MKKLFVTMLMAAAMLMMTTVEAASLKEIDVRDIARKTIEPKPA